MPANKKIIITLFVISLAITYPILSVAASQEQESQPASSLVFTDETIAENYYLFSPIPSTETYLMNGQGVAVYTWTSDLRPGHSVYLLENGNLLRTGSIKTGVFDAGGSGGVVQEIAPDSSIVWEYVYASDQVQQHHDIEQLPNGNILMIAWEYKSGAEAIEAGRDPSRLGDDELWADHVIEVDPASNEIVWEWHVWDHLIQDYDATKPNYGVVADHPELIDLNFTNLQAKADWNHTNAIDYNAELDQIMLSVYGFNEVWIIDHNTTTEEAAGPAGDLLYRWGNPQSYDAGSAADQQLFTQHDAQWIPAEYPGGGNILVFNNGDRQTRAYSSIDEIVPPLNSDGTYNLTPGVAQAPEAPFWSYMADNPSDFYATHISGAQRLANGNTLICSGTEGRFLEVTPDGQIVWEYTYGDHIFRVTQISADYSGIAGLELVSGETLTATSNDQRGQAQGNGGQVSSTERRARAIDACSGSNVGAACSMDTPKGTLEGTCQNRQADLVCVLPNGGQDG